MSEVQPYLDWRNHHHWGARVAKCRVCTKQTRLRDDKGNPAHKTCAEERGDDQCPDAPKPKKAK